MFKGVLLRVCKSRLYCCLMRVSSTSPWILMRFCTYALAISRDALSKFEETVSTSPTKAACFWTSAESRTWAVPLPKSESMLATDFVADLLDPLFLEGGGFTLKFMSCYSFPLAIPGLIPPSPDPPTLCALGLCPGAFGTTIGLFWVSILP